MVKMIQRIFNFQFSNFYAASFILDGRIWSTSEHYYQAMKFDTTSPEYSEVPNKAFVLANQQKKYGYASKWTVSLTDKRTLNEVIDLYQSTAKIRSDWNSIKLDVMRRAPCTQKNAH